VGTETANRNPRSTDLLSVGVCDLPSRVFGMGGDVITKLERYRAQLERLTLKGRKPAKVLTGIEKQAREEDEAREIWNELERRQEEGK
jgi:hypothetical protein